MNKHQKIEAPNNKSQNTNKHQISKAEIGNNPHILAPAVSKGIIGGPFCVDSLLIFDIISVSDIHIYISYINLN